MASERETVKKISLRSPEISNTIVLFTGSSSRNRRVSRVRRERGLGELLMATCYSADDVEESIAYFIVWRRRRGNYNL